MIWQTLPKVDNHLNVSQKRLNDSLDVINFYNYTQPGILISTNKVKFTIDSIFILLQIIIDANQIYKRLQKLGLHYYLYFLCFSNSFI